MKKTVLITGASSGIGKTTAIYFQQQGWNVAATMRNPDKEKELASLTNIHLLKLDVTDSKSIDAAIQEAIKLFGQIDVLVNNAGYGALGPFEAASTEQIKKQFDTNVLGLMNVTQSILPYFRKQNSGTIINISSIGGRITFPLYSLYHGTKWAVEGFSESLQYELRPFNIKVKIVEPGAIKTDFYDRSMDILKKDGLTVYDSYVNTALKNIQNFSRNAPGPQMVAKKIFQAATDQSWKLRYPVSKGGPTFLILRWLLPLSWFNGVVAKAIERK